MKITGAEVKAAVMAANIKTIDHHSCGLCGYMTKYIHEEGRLFFDPGCYCSRRISEIEPRSWQDAADWINMQRDEAVKAVVANGFGIDLMAVTQGETE